ncbi:MAG: CAP domain-containing protein [Bacteroidales bacterium]|nr:CAP domain-containing protein [Bacteroidales bacterium]
MKLKYLFLTALFAVFSFGAYAQVTIGRPMSRPVHTNKARTANPRGIQAPSSKSGNKTASSGTFSNDQLAKANTAKDATYLSQAEKDLILYCNLARLDGQTFANQYLSKMKNSSNSYEQSLLKDLAGIKNLPMLKPNSRLAKAAKVHVDDIGPKGLTQHESSDGTATFTRVRKYYNGGYMGENISFGYSSAMDIVLQLLVDDGVESLGHRHNILNKSFIRIGISIGSHKQYRSCCVQDFSDDRDDKNGESDNNNDNSHNNNDNKVNDNDNKIDNNKVNDDREDDDDDDYGYADVYDDDDDDDFWNDDDYYNAEDDEFYNDEGDYYDDNDNYYDDDDFWYDDDDYDDDDDFFYYDF